MNVVISQSMYFPWVGFLEQIRLSNTFVHYDDVQFSKGSFSNRVQLKTENGPRWMTIPLSNHHLGQKLNETLFDDRKNWQQQHLDLLTQLYETAPYFNEMLTLVDDVFRRPAKSLADISRESIFALCHYFNLNKGRVFIKSEDLNVAGNGSNRVHDIVLALEGDVYISGLGAQNYLKYDLFEQSGINVKLMQYEFKPYPQLHGDFTPYVSSLDLIANCGEEGAAVIKSKAIYWKDINNESD